MTVSGDYKPPMIRTAAARAIVLLLGGMVLDDGLFLVVSLVATAAYWVALLILVARHPSSPTRGDLIWAKAGFPIAFALAFTIAPLVLHWRG